MSSTPVPAARSHAAALARAQWRQSRLDELTQIGMGLVRGLPPLRDADDGMLEAIVLRFARLSRAVRLVLFLANWISHQILALGRGQMLPEPWRRPRASGVEGAGAAVRAEPDAPDHPGSTDEAEPREARDSPETGRTDVEPAERFSYASWDEAMNAICKAFGIEDRSRFLESESFPAQPAEAVDGHGAAPAEPVANRGGPAPPRPSPWAPGGVLSRRAFLRTSTALPDERMLQ